MNPHTLQTEVTRLKTERDEWEGLANDYRKSANLAVEAGKIALTECDDLRHLLTLALPYVEDALNDPAYKGAPVAELVRKIKGAV